MVSPSITRAAPLRSAARTVVEGARAHEARPRTNDTRRMVPAHQGPLEAILVMRAALPR